MKRRKKLMAKKLAPKVQAERVENRVVKADVRKVVKESNVSAFVDPKQLRLF